MTPQRKRTILILLAFIVLLLLLLWFLLAFFSRTPQTIEPSVETPVEEVKEVIPSNPTISEEAVEKERETRNGSADVISLSKTFVERYGSYSNEANFANLIDVLPLMSSALASKTESFIASNVAPEEYYGVTTQVITVNVEEKTDSEAQVRLTTQRQEATGSPQNSSVYYQEIELFFVKQQGEWRVDSVSWL
jgi:cytoskeletal protein RodZ